MTTDSERKFGNVVHPTAAPAEIIERVAEASVAVHGNSDNPLAVVTEMGLLPSEPEDMLVPIKDEDDMYALRMAGYTTKQIAHHYTKLKGQQYTVKQIDAALCKVGKENLARSAEQLPFMAQLELDRIEEAIKALWGAVQDGNLQAVDRLVKLSERKTKMLGLDAPDVAVSLRLGGSDAMDLTSLTTDELKMYLELQKKASTASKSKLVTAIPRRLGGEGS